MKSIPTTTISLKELNITPKLIKLKTNDPDNFDYWKERCILAEKYIEESPCDPDIYISQLEAYHNWKDFIKNVL